MALAGLLLTLLSVPGVWLIFASAILVALIGNFYYITPQILIVLFVVSVLSTFIDNIVSLLGVKVMGGSVWGIIGAILGGFIGFLIGNIFGIILGPLIGSLIFEYFIGRKNLKDSFKAGLGTFIGFVVTILLKTGVNVAIIVYILTLVI